MAQHSSLEGNSETTPDVGRNIARLPITSYSKNHRCHHCRPLPQRKMATMHEHDGQNNTVSAFSQQA